MRILFVSEATSQMLGGVTTELRRLVTGLNSRGHQLALASDAPVSGADASHFRLDMPRSEGTLAQLRACISGFDPDVIHVLFAFSGGALYFARELRQRPWILTCHSVPPSEWTLRHLHRHERLHYCARAVRFWRETWLATRLYAGRIPPRVIVHSELIKQVVVRRLYPESRVSIIPFGFDVFETSRAVEIRNGPHLLTVAGITHTKGLHDAIRALAVVRRRYPGARYTIVGEARDPSYLRFLKRRIAELDLTGRVEFVVNATADQVSAALDTADVFVQPSHEEGFCLSYMEAAAHVPRLVGTRTGAIPDMSCDDEGASTVPVRDPGALARAMLALIEKPLAAGLLVTRNERLAARFPWAAYLDSHEKLYAEVARAGRGLPMQI